MSENGVAKALRIIGGITIVVGVLASLIMGAEVKNAGIVIGGIVGSVISGIMFFGFSEIIDLLQQNVDQQRKIIDKLDKQLEVVKDIAKEEPKTAL